MIGNKSQLVVKQHNPVRLIVIILVLLVLSSAGGWYLLTKGRQQAGYDFTVLQENYDELKDKNSKLNSENTQLRKELALVKQGGKIEQQAYDEVRDSLKELQDEILELKEEVAFYRSIVTPSESSKGLRIQKFDVESNGQKNGFRYKLVLTQVIKNSSITRGKASISIEGVHGVEPRLLTLKEVSSSDSDDLSFKFKYFQSFEGDILLPEGFVASRIKLNIQSNMADIEKSYPWPTI